MRTRRQSRHLVRMAVGIVIVVFSIWYLGYSQGVLSFKTTPRETVKTVRSSPPAELKIPNAKIDLRLDGGIIENGIWQISAKGGSYLVTGAYPGEGGNIIIYGHNKWNILGRLKTVTKGQAIILVTQEGKEHKYQVENVMVVSPNEIEVVEPRNNEILTIYTCTGFLDRLRFVVVATPIDSEIQKPQ
ncbi:MAG: Peptidase C60, sortase A and B [Microgenomates group bacterium GW2011_GWC1_47_20]|uniref:Peptidase C60, sortase A and B n=1 Tax=Candidatus Amesbacteria bacterium GW2011_GWC2_45_19 TaxID=1618366 RepID=A0A0G1M5Q0_9BACT|nr:MAG: Peptidase C60, sortase A and B [Candidatus Amesbacteria bacterium GW2011_GWC2_45_19]KKU69555.1 MAG: Peptidase C60, sortase A and B [Microgenomates group bacterium GW2011_GWC1_47_20]